MVNCLKNTRVSAYCSSISRLEGRFGCDEAVLLVAMGLSDLVAMLVLRV